MKSLLIVTVACFLVMGFSSSRAANNCPGAGNSAGVNCTSASLCCGSGTMTPSCLPPDNSMQCCQHYASSKQCKPTEVCGGGGGPGASSYTLCGPPASTYCDKGDGQGTFCNATLPTCCGYYGGFGFCCAAGCSCNNSYYSCSCPAPSTPAPTTPPPKNNCPGAAGTAGVNCSDASLCCGYGGISPSCLPADGSRKCCTHYISSKQCQPNEVCGGGGGPGASSYTSCGAPGTTYCDKGDGQGAFCNATQPTCCGYYSGFGFCCAAGCSCNNSYYSCDCPVASTPAPSTPAPTTPPPMNNCPGAAGTAGVNCSDASLCCGYGGMSPSCLPADGSRKCCTHYISSKQCQPNEVCGGGGGPGASSYTLCGAPGTTYCDKGDGQGAFCNATQPTCCGNYGGFGFCCAAGCTCNNNSYQCNCPTTAPTTPAPTKTCVSPGPKGKPATCKVGQKCCGAKNTNAFCCNANQQCNNIKRTCV